MKKRRSFFGPSKDEIWTQIATDIGGEYIDGGFWGKDVLLYTHGEWPILLDTYTVHLITEQQRHQRHTLGCVHRSSTRMGYILRSIVKGFSVQLVNSLVCRI